MNPRIYVASSWRNARQPAVVQALMSEGFKVYDFRHPATGNDGFHWSAIDPNWRTWSARAFREGLAHPIADEGFAFDMNALRACDVCVLVLPCGRSAHLELGQAVGAGKRTIVLLDDPLSEPELMYKMVDHICIDLAEVLLALEPLREWAPPKERPLVGVKPTRERA